MSIIKKLDEEIKNWDKFEGAGSVYWMYGWNKKKETEDSKPSEKAESISDGEAHTIKHGEKLKTKTGEIVTVDYLYEIAKTGRTGFCVIFPDGTKKNISSRSLSKLDKNEDENDDYRDDTQGDRNTKYLKKARIRANTPQARLKRERTEFKKELNGQ